MRILVSRLVLISCVLLAVFALVELASPQLMDDPLMLVRSNQGASAVISFGLLAADVALPVPSSLLMIANGAVFGVFGGALLSTAASVASAALGFWIGRRGVRWMGLPEGDKSLESWLTRWGGLAIAASRPVPLLAESISILAGATTISWRTLLACSLAGSAPASAIYAYAGAEAVKPAGAALVFLLTLGLASVLWFAGYRLGSGR